MVFWQISENPYLYQEALKWMENKVGGIAKDQDDEFVWCLEHPSIYTLGTSAKKEDILDHTIPTFNTNRGGQVTYHGPGQRIIYVMLKLSRWQNDIRKFVCFLEDSVIQTLEMYGIKGERRSNRIGVWVQQEEQEKKIAAIGIRIRKGISFHGIAINLDPDLRFYNGIIPCGIKEYGVTSLKEMGANPDKCLWDQRFKEVFSKELDLLPFPQPLMKEVSL